MIDLKYIKLMLVLLMSYCIAISQTPETDPNFYLIFEDDFNTLNLTKWMVWENPPWDGDTTKPYFSSRIQNVSVNNGVLKLSMFQDGYMGYRYSSGAIRSKQSFYPGSYLVSRAQITNDQSIPAFWLWEGDGGCNNGDFREIDILEWFGNIKESSSNFHFCEIGCTPDPDENGDKCRRFIEHHYKIPNEFSYHTYECFWNSNKTTFVLDGITINERNTPPQLNQSMKIDNGNGYGVSYKNVNIPSSISMDFFTDFIRVYRLHEDCNTDIVEISNFSTYLYAVKKSIKLSGATTVPVNNEIHLRANEFIELNNGFEVPNNTTISFNTNECYN